MKKIPPENSGDEKVVDLSAARKAKLAAAAPVGAGHLVTDGSMPVDFRPLYYALPERNDVEAHEALVDLAFGLPLTLVYLGASLEPDGPAHVYAAFVPTVRGDPQGALAICG